MQEYSQMIFEEGHIGLCLGAKCCSKNAADHKQRGKLHTNKKNPYSRYIFYCKKLEEAEVEENLIATEVAQSCHQMEKIC